MNTSFERTINPSDEWYTPKEIIDSLGHFDLDPCAPVNPLWETADVMYNKIDDGLKQNWGGRVWLNPPYSKPLLNQFIERMVKHNNGIALLFNRLDSNLFQKVILQNAMSMKILQKRIKFFKPNGIQGGSPGCGSILFAFGEYNDMVLKNNGLEGVYIKLK